MTEDKIFTGAIIHTPSPLDYTMREIAFASSPFDWNKGYDVEEQLGIKLVIKDQGNSSSCGGQAWAYYGEVLDYVYNKEHEPKSAKFIYAQTFVHGGGSDGRTNSLLLTKQGWGTEKLTVSYQNGQAPSEDFMTRPQDITAEARKVALLDLALSFGYGAIDIDTIAQSVRDNHGVVIGITGANNGTWRTAYPTPYKTGDSGWNHWLYVGGAKIINGKKYLKVCNSWGTETGEAGWQWLSESHIKNIWVCWNIVYKKTVPVVQKKFTTVMIYGQTNEDVRAMQVLLQKLGFFPKNVNTTGYYGDITARAVKAFQISMGLLDFQHETNLSKIRAGEKTLAKLNTVFDK